MSSVWLWIRQFVEESCSCASSEARACGPSRKSNSSSRAISSPICTKSACLRTGERRDRSRANVSMSGLASASISASLFSGLAWQSTSTCVKRKSSSM